MARTLLSVRWTLSCFCPSSNGCRKSLSRPVPTHLVPGRAEAVPSSPQHGLPLDWNIVFLFLTQILYYTTLYPHSYVAVYQEMVAVQCKVQCNCNIRVAVQCKVQCNCNILVAGPKYRHRLQHPFGSLAEDIAISRTPGPLVGLRRNNDPYVTIFLVTV